MGIKSVGPSDSCIVLSTENVTLLIHCHTIYLAAPIKISEWNGPSCYSDKKSIVIVCNFHL